MDWRGGGWRGQKYHNKEIDLNPTADLDHIFEESMLMERENAVAVEGGSKFQGLLSFHVGENVRV